MVITVVWILGLVIGLCVLSWCGWGFWVARAARQQDEERARFDRILAASDPPRTWPPVRGPKGFTPRRNGSNGRVA